MKYLMIGAIALAFMGCDQRLQLKNCEQAQIFDNDKLVYQSECVAFTSFDVNDKNVGILRLRDGNLSTIEVRTFDMADKAHSYVFKKSDCE